MSIAVTLREARDLYVKMGEAAETLRQAAKKNEGDFQRLSVLLTKAEHEAESMQVVIAEGVRKFNSSFSQIFWLMFSLVSSAA